MCVSTVHSYSSGLAPEFYSEGMVQDLRERNFRQNFMDIALLVRLLAPY